MPERKPVSGEEYQIKLAFCVAFFLCTNQYHFPVSSLSTTTDYTVMLAVTTTLSYNIIQQEVRLMSPFRELHMEKGNRSVAQHR